MKFIIQPSALDDLEQAASFYDQQEPGLGDECLSDLEAEIRGAYARAGQHMRVGRYHRCVTRGRFPYFCIYYTLESGAFHVKAVLDHRRDPRFIQDRLSGR